MKEENRIVGKRVARRRAQRRRRRKIAAVAAAVVMVILTVVLVIWHLADEERSNADDVPPSQQEISSAVTLNGALSAVIPRMEKQRTAEEVLTGSPENPAGGTNTSDEPESITPNRGKEPIPDPRKSERPWNLALVNPWNAVSGEPITLTELSCGGRVDSRCADALEQMLDDCRAQGLTPIVCSSYRTWATQQSLFDGTVEQYMYSGYSYADAVQKAATETAWPGTSEHQLGLAVDIVDVDYQLLDDAQADTPVQQWLMANCWRYGFILRYTEEKEPLTGIIYEPWHYRYVGMEAAESIYRSGLCLEEWLAAN